MARPQSLKQLPVPRTRQRAVCKGWGTTTLLMRMPGFSLREVIKGLSSTIGLIMGGTAVQF